MNSWFEPDLILLVRFCITCRAHVLRRHRSYFTDASILICTLCTLCVLRRACSVWTAWYAVATTLWTATSSLVLLLRLRPALPTLPILNSKSFAWHSPYLHLVYLQVQSCSSIFLLQFCNFNVQTFNQLITAAFESADCFVVRTTRPCFNVSKPSWIDLLFWVLLSVRHMYWRPERFVFPLAASWSRKNLFTSFDDDTPLCFDSGSPLSCMLNKTPPFLVPWSNVAADVQTTTDNHFALYFALNSPSGIRLFLSFTMIVLNVGHWTTSNRNWPEPNVLLEKQRGGKVWFGVWFGRGSPISVGT